MDNIESIEKILREIKVVYEPDPSKNCFSAEKVLNELDGISEKFRRIPRNISIILLITSHLFSGECIDVGESVADFLDDIFLHYGDRCERIITQSGFTKLWNDLQTQRKGKHIDHGVQKVSCDLRNKELRMLQKNEVDSSSTETEQSIISAATKIVLVNNPLTKLSTHQLDADFSLGNHSAVTKDTNDSSVKQFPLTTNSTKDAPFSNGEASATTLEMTYRVMKDSESNIDKESDKTNSSYEVEIVTNEANTTSKRISRHTHISDEHEHKNLANECLPSDDLLRRFLTRGNEVITSLEFLQLCPALVQQAVSGVCNTRLPSSTIPRGSSEFTTNNDTGVAYEATNIGGSWRAVAAVSIITAASFMGLFLLPLLKKPIFLFVNAFFTGLAFGTMSGDVVMHIMPQYLGLHEHDEDGHGHDESEETIWDRYFPTHLQRQLLFLLTMYALFVVESLFTSSSGQEHSHSHGPVEIPMKDLKKPSTEHHDRNHRPVEVAMVVSEQPEDTKHHGDTYGPVEIPIRGIEPASDVENAEASPKLSRCMRIMNFFKPSNIVKGITSKVIVILLADTIHNFADGMAIAVGYSSSNKDGFSTSVAVFFHELPHEIGDFALLMNCGLSYWQAFFFNVTSGFTAFIGVGIGVFTASVFREWLLCITAGLFFFVVMGEMLPDMKLESKEKWREFLVKIFGTLTGIFTMICIAVYEQM